MCLSLTDAKNPHLCDNPDLIRAPENERLPLLAELGTLAANTSSMKTSLLRQLRRGTQNRRTRWFTVSDPVFGAVPFDLTRCRTAKGHYLRLVWFPCWLLNCVWDATTYTAQPRRLRALLAAALERENAHYLPGAASTAFRSLLK